MNTWSPSLWAIMRGPISYTYTLLWQKGISLLIRVTRCPCGLEHIFWNILLLLGLGFPTVPIYLYLLLQWLFYLNLKLSLILVFSVHYTLVSELLLYDFLSSFVKRFHFLTSYSSGQWFLSQPPLQLPWPRSPSSCWSLRIPGATLSPRPIWPCRIAAPLHKTLLPDLPLPSYLLSSAGPLNAVVAEFYPGHFGSFCVLSTWVNRMWCPHLGALAASVFSCESLYH